MNLRSAKTLDEMVFQITSLSEELGSCISFPLVNALDGDALYSRSYPSDLE